MLISDIIQDLEKLSEGNRDLKVVYIYFGAPLLKLEVDDDIEKRQEKIVCLK